MALIQDGSAETAAERNARLQSAFNQAQTQPASGTTTPYYPATSYMAPDVPVSVAPDVPSANAQHIMDQYNQTQQQPQYAIHQDQQPVNQEQTSYWGDFYSQGTQPQPPVQSSWTEQELEMLGGMPVQQAINWGANYTGQALFGGWNVITGEAYTGAFNMETGELVNPSLMPSLLSPEFAYALGISEEQREMLGYNPEYPYNLQDIPAGSGGGDGGGGYSGGGYSGGGYSPSRGYGYSSTGRWGLTNWRIG